MAAKLAGTADVIDGDTINLAGAKIRLWGIDALEHDQTCEAETARITNAVEMQRQC